MLVALGNTKVNKMFASSHIEHCRKKRTTLLYYVSITRYEKINTKQTHVLYQESPGRKKVEDMLLKMCRLRWKLEMWKCGLKPLELGSWFEEVRPLFWQ